MGSAKSVAKYRIGNQDLTLYHTSEKVEPQNLLQLCLKSSLFPKAFWQYRDSTSKMLAVGSIASWSEAPSIQLLESLEGNKFEPFVFGGQSFDSTSDYKPFYSPFFFLPQFLFIEDPNETTLHTFSLDSKSPTPLKLNIDIQNDSPFLEIKSTHHLPDQSRWCELIESCHQDFKQNKVHKVVLARKTTLTFNNKISHSSLLGCLEKSCTDSSRFAFILDPNTCFLGSSPETLFKREGDSFETEALAGTLPITSKGELLSHQKNSKEFEYVTSYLSRFLDQYTHSISKSPCQEVPFKNLIHLKVQYKAKFKKPISDMDLISHLHPTPAIGGSPKEEALKKIKACEPFKRGWYSAPVGCIKENSSEFVVAIRSLYATGNEVNLFSGCGIIPQSDPIEEWNELNHKIEPYMQFFKEVQNV